MQGTIAVLMALSGLGCHHKSCAPVYAPAYASCYSGCYGNTGYGGGCYGGGCYGTNFAPTYATGQTFPAQQSYPTAYMSGCYGSCYPVSYSSCNNCGQSNCGGGCFSGCGGKHRLFGGGLFHRRRCGGCNTCGYAPVATYNGCDSCGWGTTSVYGSYTPVVPMTQGYSATTGDTGTVSTPLTPVPGAGAPPPAATTPPPPPAPVPAPTTPPPAATTPPPPPAPAPGAF